MYLIPSTYIFSSEELRTSGSSSLLLTVLLDLGQGFYCITQLTYCESPFISMMEEELGRLLSPSERFTNIQLLKEILKCFNFAAVSRSTAHESSIQSF